jgi:hypothetical protein
MNMNKSAVTLSAGVLLAALATTGALAHGNSGGQRQATPGSGTHMMNPGTPGAGEQMGMRQGSPGTSGMMGRGMGGAMMGGMMGNGHMPHNPALHHNPDQEINLSSEEDVRKILTEHLAYMGNQRLKVGDIKQQADGTFLADIDTVDNSLVRRLRIDPKTGAMQPQGE